MLGSTARSLSRIDAGQSDGNGRSLQRSMLRCMLLRLLTFCLFGSLSGDGCQQGQDPVEEDQGEE